jgi:hypothetical protein
MKKSEAALAIAEFLIEPKSDDPICTAEQILERLEKFGMLPPTNTCRLVEDELRPDMTKHSESKREWDPE